MSRERETTTNKRQEEMTVLARYAQQESVPFDLVADKFKIDPFDDFLNEYFENAKDRFLYTCVTMHYRNMPGEEMDFEVAKFIGAFGEYKKNLESSPELVSVPEASDAIGTLNLDSAANFFAFMHGKYLHQAVAELELDDFIGDDSVSRLVYWSRLDKIAREAIDRLTPKVRYETVADTF